MSELPLIYGFNKTSEMGPQLFAPSIFLGGCNMRCPYCMNSESVLRSVPEIDLNTVKKHVEDFDCKWIMISGGEPTITRPEMLVNLFNELRSWGIENIGMSTNGTRPDILKLILPHINYVAMDLKTASTSTYKKYSLNTKEAETYAVNIVKSCVTLKLEAQEREDFEFEFRTTLYPDFIKRKDIKEIGELAKNQTWILQPFRQTKFMLSEEAESVGPYSEEQVQELLELASEYTNKVEIRYV
jgi:pyruvate formate lyase activating enzyme